MILKGNKGVFDVKVLAYLVFHITVLYLLILDDEFAQYWQIFFQ